MADHVPINVPVNNDSTVNDHSGGAACPAGGHGMATQEGLAHTRSNQHEADSNSRRNRRGVLVGVDFQRITDRINGKLQNPRPVTLKSVVRQQIANIRAAQRRGLTLREVAAAITEGGCPIEEATLRKYLHLLSVEKKGRQKAVAPGGTVGQVPPKPEPKPDQQPSGSAASAVPGIPEVQATVSPGGRTLRRSSLLSNFSSDGKGKL